MSELEPTRTYSNPTATEVLRRLLDERGVEWWQSVNTLGCVFTRWHSPLFGDEIVAMENDKEGLVLFDHFMTPEQAIDATLGRGTCRDVCAGISEFTCSACGFNCDLTSWISLFDGDEGRHRHHHHGTPNYCPNCGRRVDA